MQIPLKLAVLLFRSLLCRNFCSAKDGYSYSLKQFAIAKIINILNVNQRSWLNKNKRIQYGTFKNAVEFYVLTWKGLKA